MCASSTLAARASIVLMRRGAAAHSGTGGAGSTKRSAKRDAQASGHLACASGPRRRAKRAHPAADAAAVRAPDAPAASSGALLLQYEGPRRALLLKRYKRFLGDVHFLPPTGEDGAAAALVAAAEEAADPPTVVHLPNTGPMTGMLGHLPSECLLSTSASATRKYAHTLEWIRPHPGAAWVGAHSAKANAIVRALLEAHALPQLPPYGRIQQEVKYGKDGKSRVDFVLHASASAGPAAAATLPEPVAKGASPAAAISCSCYVEVKSVTDHAELEGGAGRIALFPDTPSPRAQRHVAELTAHVRAGGAAACVFCVQRDDCFAFAPNHAKDPAYGKLLIEAAEAGVQMVAVAVGLDAAAGGVRLHGALPVRLRHGLPS